MRASFSAFNARDVDAVLASVHPEIEVRPALVGGLEGTVYRGPQGVREFLADIDAVWDEFRIEPTELRELGDTVLALGRAVGRGRGSGVDVETAAGWTVAVRDGKVHRFSTFVSREAALDAVGLRE